MSMLNRRTQPLDPAVLQSLTALPPTAAPARSTSPLKEPGALIDNLAPATTRRTEVPAQASAITSALSAPPVVDGAPMSEDQAELLLDVSAKLAEVREQDPIKFQTVMAALRQLGTDASGQVDFSSLSPVQQQTLMAMGMNAQNTKMIFHQLYAMLLPGTQQESSQAFKQIQAQVTGFISNLDLRQSAVSQIQQKARDLTAVQGIVSSLSASSINDLIADQTNSVYDLSVSKINSQNFDIRNGMDYTLGHMVLLSQESPTTLQQVEGLIQKIKTDQAIDAGEQTLLQRFGLNLNQQNKLQTIDGNVLDYKAVNKLEEVISSMKDPSEGYQKVLQASAAVISQSHKLEQLSSLAQQQSVQVQQTTQQVVQSTQNLEQIRQDANHLDAQLQFAGLRTNNLLKAMDAAAGLMQTVNIDPQLLSQWNIQIVSNGQGPGTQRFFHDGKEISRLDMRQLLDRLLSQQRQEVATMSAELAHKKTEALTATAQLGATTKTLETQKADLQTTEQVIDVATKELHRLQDEEQKVIAAELPHLKPAEKQIVETQIVPITAHEATLAFKAAEQAVAEIHRTVTKAETALAHARAVQQAVADDIRHWEEDLRSGKDLIQQIDQAVETKPESAPVDTPNLQQPSETPAEAAALAPQPKTPDFEQAGGDELQAKALRQEQARSQKRNEESFLESTRNQQAFDEDRRRQAQVDERAKKDAQMLKSETDRLKQ